MKSDIGKKLTEIFLSNFKDMSAEDFSLDKDRSEFENWDSLTHLQLVSEIETAFSVSFDMDEIVEIQKPSNFIPIIEKKHAN